jgi:hypothetical protein
MALVLLGTVGNAYSPNQVGSSKVLGSGTFTETGVTISDSCEMMRFWFAGNGESSYYVTSAYAVQGALSLQITVWGKTGFWVPSYGRYSDAMSVSNFTTPGSINVVSNIATEQNLPVFTEGTKIVSLIETNAYDLSDGWTSLSTNAFPDSSVRGKIVGRSPLLYTLNFTVPAMPAYIPGQDVGVVGFVYMDSQNTGLGIFFHNICDGDLLYGAPNVNIVNYDIAQMTEDVETNWTLVIDRRSEVTGYDYLIQYTRVWTSGGTTYVDSGELTTSCSPGEADLYDLKNYACNGLMLRGSIWSDTPYDLSNFTMTVQIMSDPEEITTTVEVLIFSNPSPGDTLTINNSSEHVFTFVNHYATLSTEIQIGATIAETATNIADKINALPGAEFVATASDASPDEWYVVTVTGYTETGVTITTTADETEIRVNETTTIYPVLIEESATASDDMTGADGGKEETTNIDATDIMDGLIDENAEAASVTTTMDCLVDFIEESGSVSVNMDGLIDYMGEEVT